MDTFNKPIFKAKFGKLWKPKTLFMEADIEQLYKQCKNSTAKKECYIRTILGKIESLRWNVYGQRATINFRINKLFTDNLEETKDTPDGQ